MKIICATKKFSISKIVRDIVDSRVDVFTENINDDLKDCCNYPGCPYPVYSVYISQNAVNKIKDYTASVITEDLKNRNII